MINVDVLIAKAQELGATFIPGEGDKLKVQAPAPLPQDLVEELKEHKPEILALLKVDHPYQHAKASPEDLAAGILAENTPDEASLIVKAWREILGIPLDRQRVINHLKELRKWQAQWRG